MFVAVSRLDESIATEASILHVWDTPCPGDRPAGSAGFGRKRGGDDDTAHRNQRIMCRRRNSRLAIGTGSPFDDQSLVQVADRRPPGMAWAIRPIPAQRRVIGRDLSGQSQAPVNCQSGFGEKVHGRTPSCPINCDQLCGSFVICGRGPAWVNARQPFFSNNSGAVEWVSPLTRACP